MSRVCPYNLRSCIIYIILCDHTYFSPLNIAVLLTLYPTFKFPLSFLCLNHFTSNHKSAVIFNFHFFNANKHRCNHHALTSADHPSTWRWVNVNRLLHLSSLFLCQHLDHASIFTFLSFFLFFHSFFLFVECHWTFFYFHLQTFTFALWWTRTLTRAWI